MLTSPADVTPRDGEEKVDETEAIRRMLAMSEWDPKPVVLYFHRDHEDENAEAGKPWAKQCRQLDDERVARWSGLYHFVEVDAAKSDETMLERFGAREGPSFAVVNRDLEVVTTSGTIPSAKKFAAYLKSTVKEHFADYWSSIQEQLDEQEDTLREAKSLEKKKDIVNALEKVRRITRSSLRVGDFFDDAVALDEKLTRKLAEED